MKTSPPSRQRALLQIQKITHRERTWARPIEGSPVNCKKLLNEMMGCKFLNVKFPCVLTHRYNIRVNATIFKIRAHSASRPFKLQLSLYYKMSQFLTECFKFWWWGFCFFCVFFLQMVSLKPEASLTCFQFFYIPCKPENQVYCTNVWPPEFSNLTLSWNNNIVSWFLSLWMF